MLRDLIYLGSGALLVTAGYFLCYNFNVRNKKVKPGNGKEFAPRARLKMNNYARQLENTIPVKHTVTRPGKKEKPKQKE